MENKDPRLFSLSTPKEGVSAYKRVFDPKDGVAPTSKRIVQDIHKVVNALAVIHREKGVFVPGLAGGRTPGHRHTKTTEKTSNNHIGKRVRTEILSNSQLTYNTLAVKSEAKRS